MSAPGAKSSHPGESALSAVGLRFGYRSGEEILRGLNFSLASGEMTALVGPNGSGKSTLLRILAGLLRPGAGTVRLGQRALADVPRRELARRVALVPQETRPQLPFTVGEMVLMGRSPYIGYLGMESERDVAVAREACERTDVWRLRDRIVSELSGGEKQRAVIARALAQEPEILLLDEPTTFLDLRHEQEVYAILAGLARESSISVLVVEHDLNAASRHSGRICMLSGGVLVREGPPGDVLNPESIREVFGVEATVERVPGAGLLVAPRGSPRASGTEDARP